MWRQQMTAATLNFRISAGQYDEGFHGFRDYYSFSEQELSISYIAQPPQHTATSCLTVLQESDRHLKISRSRLHSVAKPEMACESSPGHRGPACVTISVIGSTEGLKIYVNEQHTIITSCNMKKCLRNSSYSLICFKHAHNK